MDEYDTEGTDKVSIGKIRVMTRTLTSLQLKTLCSSTALPCGNNKLKQRSENEASY